MPATAITTCLEGDTISFPAGQRAKIKIVGTMRTGVRLAFPPPPGFRSSAMRYAFRQAVDVEYLPLMVEE